MAYNHAITFVGNLTRKPELRTTGSGKSVTTLSLAVNEGMDDKERTTFVDVAVWEQMAENVVESFDKGSRVIVTATLGSRDITVVGDDDEEYERKMPTFTAVHVGAELRFATVEVHKTPKKRHDDDFDDDEDEAPKTRRRAARKDDDDEAEEAPKTNRRRTARKAADDEDEAPKATSRRRSARKEAAADDDDDF